MGVILNYTTQVDAAKSIGEITALLVRKGAQSIITDYDNGRVKAISFTLKVGEALVPFRLPANVDGVFQLMLARAPWNYSRRSSKLAYIAGLREQAERASWRIVKDWVEAQLALLESSQAELAQIFLPYVVRADGRTMYAAFLESTQKSLGAGE